MPKLSDTQLVILSAAMQHPDGAILPLPKSIKARGAALTKLIYALKRQRLVAELPRDPNSPLDPVLAITDAGREAIGAGVPETPSQPDSLETEAGTSGDAPLAAQAATARTARAGSKLAQVIALLRTEHGATLAEIVGATGWQAHSVRGAISGALRKKLGLTVNSEKVEGRGRVYRIVDGLPAGGEAVL